MARCSTDIADYINKSEVCIKASKVKHQPADDSPLPEKPWTELGSDLFEMNNKQYLLVVDYYSKWIEVRELCNQSSESVIKAMMSIFSCFGMPKILRSDNGGCYASDAFKNFANEINCNLFFLSQKY